MPTYQHICTVDTCLHAFEDTRPVSRYQENPPCPTCGAPSERHYVPASVPGMAPVVVVYQGPDGQVRYPGLAGGSALYEHKPGFTRVEIRGAAEMRKFEKSMNARDFSLAMRKTEQQQRFREAQERVNRSELRARMQSMSTWGRDMARAAMSMNDERPRERTKDPGFHSEVYSYDRGSREGARGSDGRRLRD